MRGSCLPLGGAGGLGWDREGVGKVLVIPGEKGRPTCPAHTRGGEGENQARTPGPVPTEASEPPEGPAGSGRSGKQGCCPLRTFPHPVLCSEG